MKRSLVIQRKARGDMVQTRNWYNKQRLNLGEEFIDSVEVLLAYIEQFPEAYAAEYKEVRRARLNRFPYIVYYRLVDEKIEVLAVLHGSRHPRVWQGRT